MAKIITVGKSTFYIDDGRVINLTKLLTLLTGQSKIVCHYEGGEAVEIPLFGGDTSERWFERFTDCVKTEGEQRPESRSHRKLFCAETDCDEYAIPRSNFCGEHQPKPATVPEVNIIATMPEEQRRIYTPAEGDRPLKEQLSWVRNEFAEIAEIVPNVLPDSVSMRCRSFEQVFGSITANLKAVNGYLRGRTIGTAAADAWRKGFDAGVKAHEDDITHTAYEVRGKL